MHAIPHPRRHRPPAALPACVALAAGLLSACAHDRGSHTVQPGQHAQSRHVQAVITIDETVRFLLYLPPGYRDDPDRRWPLMFFLHGSGERGTDLRQVKAWGPPSMLEGVADYPFIVVSPQVPMGQSWNPHVLHGLLQRLQRELRIDPDRVVATGLSMGGFGVWNWALEYPHDLAAIAPIAGGGDDDRACRATTVPVWAFHGEADTVVPLKLGQDMVDALRQCGGQARLTTYPGVGHDAWVPAYRDPELLRWLQAQRRPKP